MVGVTTSLDHRSNMSGGGSRVEGQAWSTSGAALSEATWESKEKEASGSAVVEPRRGHFFGCASPGSDTGDPIWQSDPMESPISTPDGSEAEFLWEKATPGSAVSGRKDMGTDAGSTASPECSAGLIAFWTEEKVVLDGETAGEDKRGCRHGDPGVPVAGGEAGSGSAHRQGGRSCDLVVQVRVLWTALSALVAAVCCFALLQPSWLENPTSGEVLGLYNYCPRDRVTSQEDGRHQGDTHRIPWQRQHERLQRHLLRCGPYGDYFRLGHLPSNAWQIACVLFAGGCALMVFGTVTAVVTSLLRREWVSRLASYTGYIQTMAVVTLASGLLVLPVGFDSPFVEHYCPGSRMYQAGSCHVGWAYLLGMMGTALAFFCPFLSQYVTLRDDKQSDSYL